MKSQFEINDKNIIKDILQSTDYGTLGLSNENKPYSVPVNFVYIDETIYFHGSKKGKKAEYIASNPFASFSVVEPYSLIQSYFSSNENLACPATHFFRSVSIEGSVKIEKNYAAKVYALESLMQKLQSEGKYIPLDDEVYESMIEKIEVFRLAPTEIRGKIKLGQHLPKDRFEMILDHLDKRGDDLDKQTARLMRENYIK